ncbi:helix-turn-helix transcriptional regulator [Xylophilus sp. ASV27]|uniref:helix-turn-helix transcriptional regulator n=1 Tax=Xylophilus sp. ASV27 TaxID=2795129 RepID=UPI001E438104|nr:LuxR C-terminal-related transcriptional regulator [Xylophilus sp. ASV27]
MSPCTGRTGNLMADYSHLLLRLYRLSHEQPVDRFQDEALELLKHVLPFDSAMWGSATMTAGGIDVHTIHLHRQPAEMLMAYEEIKHLDTAAQVVVLRPSETRAFDARAWFNGRHQRALLDYGRRFEQSHFFIGSMQNPATRFGRWLSLFRASPDAHGTEGERQLLATLMPHIQQALELNRLTHLNQLVHAPGAARLGSALADPRGMLHHMDAVFERALRTEWPCWAGSRLPEPVMAAAQRGEPRLLARSLVITLHAQHGLLWLRARPRCAADALSPREDTVARLLALGLTHKQIAARLQRSPATVRNQIQSVYDKLGVSNVAAMADALRQAD